MIKRLAELWFESEAAYRRRTPRSAAEHSRALSVLPGGDTRSATFVHPYPLTFERSEGAYVVDVDENHYLDCCNNWATLVLGHLYPAVTDAVQRQAQCGWAWSGMNEAAIELGRLLQTRVPSVERIRFTSSGSEAVMLAARAARAFTGRRGIARAKGSYHGSHEAFDVLGESSLIQDPIAADHVVEFEFNDVDGTTELLSAHRRNLAAVLVEPFPTHPRLQGARVEFLQRLRIDTERYGILLIFDEVVTLRTAMGGAQGLCGVRPDLTTMGKMIGGGYPVGALGGRREIMDQFSPFNDRHIPHSGTFNGNPITMTAGLATLRTYDDAAIARLNALGERLRAGLAAAAENVHLRIDVICQGSLVEIGLAPTGCEADEQRRASSLMRRILMTGLLNEGILSCPPGSMLALSTAMTEHDIDATVKKVARVLDSLQQGSA